MPGEHASIRTGVWEGKAVTCFLFNIVSEDVRNARLKIRGNIF